MGAPAKAFWQWAEEFAALGFAFTRHEYLVDDRLMSRFIATHSAIATPLDFYVVEELAVLRLAVEPHGLPEHGLQVMLEMAAGAVGRTV